MLRIRIFSISIFSGRIRNTALASTDLTDELVFNGPPQSLREQADYVLVNLILWNFKKSWFLKTDIGHDLLAGSQNNGQAVIEWLTNTNDWHCTCGDPRIE